MSKNTKQPLAQQFRTIVAEQLGMPTRDVKLTSRFIEDLGADSLDTVELIMAVEDYFVIQIPDEDAERIKSVNDALEYLSYKLPGTGGTEPPQAQPASNSALETAETVMVERNVADLTSQELNWAVAGIVGDKPPVWSPFRFAGYDSDWAIGGKLVEQYQISMDPQYANGSVSSWVCRVCAPTPHSDERQGRAHASTQLRAAMLALVHQFHGDQVKVPAEIASS